MTPDLPPLDPDLALLLDAERRRAAPPAEVRDAVSANLAAAMSAPPAASTSRGGAWGARRAIQGAIASFVVGGALGAWIATRTLTTPPAPPTVAPSTARAPEPSAPVTAAAPNVRPPVETVRDAPSAAPAASSSTPRAATSTRAPDPDLAAEQVLVETGRSALARGDSARALAALDRHAREFPRGRLAEEREVLAVQALALAGRADEARARATSFRARYPRSVFLPMLDEALRATP